MQDLAAEVGQGAESPMEPPAGAGLGGVDSAPPSVEEDQWAAHRPEASDPTTTPCQAVHRPNQSGTQRQGSQKHPTPGHGLGPGG